jgi:phosphate transport system substrate-binding protein
MKKIIILYFAFLIGISCNQTPSTTYDETPTRGNIKIDVDESFKMLMDTEIFTFSSEYTYAKITTNYKPEYDVINDFMNDSVRTIVTAQKLTQSQTDYLKNKTIYPRTTTIATDAVAFIINRKNQDSLIQINDMKQIFLGGITNWNQIDKKNKSGKIEVVFDNNKSANARYFIDKLNLKEFPKNCYTAGTNDEVLKYVEKNENAVGIISVNWISVKTDVIAQYFLKRVKVVGLTSELDPEGNSYYKPYAAYIADNSYPFTRDIYMITRETFDGLGSGLTRYVAGEKGQRIALKAGLVPATMPHRFVQVKTK